MRQTPPLLEPEVLSIWCKFAGSTLALCAVVLFLLMVRSWTDPGNKSKERHMHIASAFTWLAIALFILLPTLIDMVRVLLWEFL